MTNRDQGWQGIADDRQADGTEPSAWQHGQLKGQWQHTPPGFLAQPTTKRGHHEDGHGKGLVLAVASDDRLGDGLGREGANGAADPGFAALGCLKALAPHPFPSPVGRGRLQVRVTKMSG